jgi:glycosyltransferase involved in cell wall biosynthesis
MGRAPRPRGPLMRVLLCSPRFAPQLGGAETWTREVARGLAARGHAVRAVSRAAPGVAPRDRRDGVEVLRATGGRTGLSRAVAAHARAWGPDAILAQYAALPAAVTAARALRIPVLAIVHDFYGLRDSVRMRGLATGLARTMALEQWMRALAPDGFLVPSHATAARLASLAGSRPVTVVPAGADHLPGGTDVPRDRTQLLFVGRLVPSKGVDDLVDAMATLRARSLRCRLVVIGTGPDAARLASRASPLGDAVRFAGSLDDATLDREIRRSLALLLPSRREGWGLALTEAASRGTAYIAYDVPAVREQHGLLGGGVLVPADPAALAEAIAGFVRVPALAAELGGRGRAAAASLSWARAAAVVESAIGAARAPQAR